MGSKSQRTAAPAPGADSSESTRAPAPAQGGGRGNAAEAEVISQAAEEEPGILDTLLGGDEEEESPTIKGMNPEIQDILKRSRKRLNDKGAIGPAGTTEMYVPVQGSRKG